MSKKLALLAILALPVSSWGQSITAVKVRFVKSPFADYLFYLLNRETGEFPALKSTIDLTKVPPLGHLTFAPEDAISSNLSNYSQLYKLVASYDDHVILTKMLHEGEPHYAAFKKYWDDNIAPQEDRCIVRWQSEYEQWRPFDRLQQLELVKFPFDSVAIDVIALDPSGSSMQGTPTIFTAFGTIPDLAWVVGHEGTHMALGPKGANWTKRPRADEAIRLVSARGGGEYDIEEAMCLLMQVRLSREFGGTSADYRASAQLSASPRRDLLIALEKDWDSFLADPDGNAADFMIRESIRSFQSSPIQ